MPKPGNKELQRRNTISINTHSQLEKDEEVQEIKHLKTSVDLNAVEKKEIMNATADGFKELSADDDAIVLKGSEPEEPELIGFNRTFAKKQEGEKGRMPMVREALDKYYKNKDEGIEDPEDLKDIINACNAYSRFRFSFFKGDTALRRMEGVEDIKREAQRMLAVEVNKNKKQFGNDVKLEQNAVYDKNDPENDPLHETPGLLKYTIGYSAHRPFTTITIPFWMLNESAGDLKYLNAEKKKKKRRSPKPEKVIVLSRKKKKEEVKTEAEKTEEVKTEEEKNEEIKRVKTQEIRVNNSELKRSATFSSNDPGPGNPELFFEQMRKNEQKKKEAKKAAEEQKRLKDEERKKQLKKEREDREKEEREKKEREKKENEKKEREKKEKDKKEQERKENEKKEREKKDKKKDKEKAVEEERVLTEEEKKKIIEEPFEVLDDKELIQSEFEIIDDAALASYGIKKKDNARGQNGERKQGKEAREENEEEHQPIDEEEYNRLIEQERREEEERIRRDDEAFIQQINEQKKKKEEEDRKRRELEEKKKKEEEEKKRKELEEKKRNEEEEKALKAEEKALMDELENYVKEEPDENKHYERRRKKILEIHNRFITADLAEMEKRVDDAYRKQKEEISRKGANVMQKRQVEVKEPAYTIDAPDSKFSEQFTEGRLKNRYSLFYPDDDLKADSVFQDNRINDCYLVAALGALALRDPDYVKKTLITNDPDDEKKAIVRLYDENGQMQRIRVQKTVSSDNGRPMWVDLVEKAACVLLARYNDAVGYRYEKAQKKDWSKHKVADRSLKKYDIQLGHENLATRLIYGREGLLLRTRNASEKTNDYTSDGTSKEMLHKAGDEVIGKILAYTEAGKSVIASTCTNGGSLKYNLQSDSVLFPMELQGTHEYVVYGEGQKKDGQRTLRIRDAKKTATMDIPFGIFKICFTDVNFSGAEA